MGTKLSQIVSGGAVAGATDVCVAVRSGVTDVLVTPVTLDAIQTWSAAQTFSNPVVGTQPSSDNSTKAASTAYVNTVVSNAIAGVNPAVAVQAATAAILPNTPTYSNGASGIGATLTAGANAALVVDGYTVLLNDRVLVKNQATAANNGIYVQTTLGTGLVPWVLTRATDFNQPADMSNTGAIPVVNGTANTDTSWVLTSKITTVGTDAVTFTQFSLNPTTIATLAANNAFTGNNTHSGSETFTGAVIQTPHALTFSSSISWNVNSGTNITITCSSNTNFTLNFPSNLTAGMGGMITITQYATGGQVITWGSGFRGPGGVKPVLSTGAGAVDEIAWYSPDGGHIDLVIQKAFT